MCQVGVQSFHYCKEWLEKQEKDSSLGSLETTRKAFLKRITIEFKTIRAKESKKYNYTACRLGTINENRLGLNVECTVMCSVWGHCLRSGT